MILTSIMVNPALSRRQRALILQWLVDRRSIERETWPATLTAFDRLQKSLVTVRGKTLTFAAFYEREIEDTWATPCLQELLNLDDPGVGGWAILSAYARRVHQQVATLMGGSAATEEQRLLLAHCLYWWRAFGQGYLFEITIFRDLHTAGVAFEAHDLTDPRARCSDHDLTVLGWRGDVKTSTYFLHAARSHLLQHDFYVTRLFSVRRRAWQNVVMLRPEVWAELDGDTRAATLEEVLTIFPEVAEITVRGTPWIVVEYEYWKKRVQVRQNELKEESQ